MLPTQTLNPQVIKHFITVQKVILRRKFPEAKTNGKRGRPRVGFFWVLAAICVIAKIEGLTWRELPPRLSSCQFLIEEGYLQRIPSYSTFHRTWMKMTVENLETWISKIGTDLSYNSCTDLAIDSSGFEIKSGSVWRLVKWNRNFLTKTSSLFHKIHITVALPSRAVVSIAETASKTHDVIGFAKLWLRMKKKISVKRIHADKAYWSENIIAFINQEGIKAVIPCKSNSKDHGTGSPMDQIVRLQRNHKGIYKKNYKPYLRSEVEHVFGNIKIRKPIVRDLLMKNKIKALLVAFLWYNYKLELEEVDDC